MRKVSGNLTTTLQTIIFGIFIDKFRLWTNHPNDNHIINNKKNIQKKTKK